MLDYHYRFAHSKVRDDLVERMILLSLLTLMLRFLSLLEYHSLRGLEIHMPDLQNTRKCAQTSIEKALCY